MTDKTTQDTAPAEEHELTYGERFVGLKFNPSNLSEVDKIKQADARIIDDLHDIASIAKTPEEKAIAEEAISARLTAQMWAVKATTFGGYN